MSRPSTMSQGMQERQGQRPCGKGCRNVRTIDHVVRDAGISRLSNVESMAPKPGFQILNTS